MYRLIVVDDEMVIRKGMCNYIDWNAMGFEVVADFEDGKEAIEYIQSHKVEAILTDIEMAEVSGLELAKHIHDNKLPIKVVIISGYKEFEYARAAIQYNVEHYLLKPIKMKEVQDVFGRIRLELEQRNEEEKLNVSREKDFKELLPALQEQFWISLVVGGSHSRESIKKKKEMLHMDFEIQRPCSIIDVKLLIDEDSNQLYYNQHENKINLINNIFRDDKKDVSYFPIYLSNGMLKVIATIKKDIPIEEFRSYLELQMREKRESVKKLLRLKMVTQVEKTFNNIMELAEYKYELQVYIQEDTNKVRLVEEDYERLKQKYKLIMETINDGDFGELDTLVDNIFFEFRNLPIDQVRQLQINMFSMLSSKFMKMGNDLWIAMNEKVDYQKLSNINDKNQLKLVCKSILKDIIQAINKRQDNLSKTIIEKAISYMKANFDKDISLEQIADRYFLNPTYFSRLFKEFTGTTFIDYLIELRMEEAKRLLSLGKYKVYEVSQKVGYHNDKYFFRVFKNYTKQTPSEYSRKWALNDEKKQVEKTKLQA